MEKLKDEVAEVEALDVELDDEAEALVLADLAGGSSLCDL